MCPEPRVSIRCKDEMNRARWRTICNKIDDDADYEEIVHALYEYFEEDESRYATVRRKAKGTEFR